MQIDANLLKCLAKRGKFTFAKAHKRHAAAAMQLSALKMHFALIFHSCGNLPRSIGKIKRAGTNASATPFFH
jgi:hypothetical protein